MNGTFFSCKIKDNQMTNQSRIGTEVLMGMITEREENGFRFIILKKIHPPTFITYYICFDITTFVQTISFRISKRNNLRKEDIMVCMC